jgi:ABC-type branched-subunit amino acid transport system substrate-binding protein
VALVEPSGPFAAHNREIARGVAIRVDQLDRAGGSSKRVKLRVVQFEDDGRRPRAVVASLVQRGVDVLILPCNTETQAALANAAGRVGLLALSPCTPDPRAVSAARTSWAVGMTGNAQAAQLAHYAAQNQATEAYIVGEARSAYSRALTRYFRAAAKLNGVRVVGESMLGADGTISGVAKKIRTTRPEPLVVFTSASYGAVQALAARLRAGGARTAVYATDRLDLQRRFPKSLEQSVFTSFGFPRPESAEFAAQYEKAFKREPVGSFAALGFETIRVLESAIAKAGSVRPAAVTAALRRGLTVPGVGLSDKTYPGRGIRLPVTDVGIVKVLSSRPEPIVSAVPPRIPQP